MSNSWTPAGSRVLNVGLIGLGAMGRNHLRVLRGLPDVNLAGVADVSEAAVGLAVSQSGASGFLDPLAMIRDTGLDAIVIATPTLTHMDLALAAIEAGVPALIEKPLASNPEEAASIASAAQAAGVPIQVGHIERFNPALLELGRCLKDGWLSEVYAISSRRAGPMPVRIRDVGVTIDLATHDVDILCWIAGERPLRVAAETARRINEVHEDLLVGTMRFPSGTIGTLDVNWLTPTKRRALTVLGAEGMFELDYLTQRLTFTRAANLASPRMIGGFAPTFEGESIVVDVPTHEPLVAELRSFEEVVRTGREPIVGAVDGQWAVVIADALLRSSVDGLSVGMATGAHP